MTDPKTPERPELAELNRRLALTQDAARPEAVEKRHQRGQRTARENLTALVNPGSWLEHGALAVAAQRSTRSIEELAQVSPADGVLTGVGTVEGLPVAVAAYDYMVFAGTQGLVGHRKLDRLFALALERRLPLVLFAEGGGGRPNDTDVHTVAGLDTTSFLGIARLSGKVPLIGIVSGRCFAGNAALVGCCDVIIATENSNLGMAGPAMIEAGGLGKVTPEEIGPIAVQSANGVVDVRVRDEIEAVAVARRCLGYLRGAVTPGAAQPQEPLREAIPENRRRAFKVRPIIERIVDQGSVLELGRGFGKSVVTCFARLDGRAVGVIANDSEQLAGALDAAASEKLSRFLKLCDANGLALISLTDTPGFMAGPPAEANGLVRRAAGLFIAAAQLRVPMLAVVLRRGYGLGAQAMTGGHFHAPFATASWPNGEFGGMNLDGAVRLGMRKQLEAIEDPAAREEAAQAMIAEAKVRGGAINMASLLELDAVIDPAETRDWLIRGLRGAFAR